MDTSNPKKPVRLTAIKQNDRFSSLGYHSVEWGRGGTDGRKPYLVAGTEIAPEVAGVPGTDSTVGTDCEGKNSVLETWDASAVKAGLKAYDAGVPAKKAFAKRTFTKADTYDAGGRGIFLDGQAPGHVLYCAHWMELHPDFKTGGRMAVSYYDRGTRFVDVNAKGRMKEVGWITAAESYSGSPQWVSNNIVYVMDYRRGLEIVRLTDMPAKGVRHHKGDRIAEASIFAGPHDEDRSGAAVWILAGVLGVVLFRANRRGRGAGLSLPSLSR